MRLRCGTVVRERLRLVRSSGDEGSVLAIALAFLMVFGVYVGVVLQFSATGLRTMVTVRDVATGAYAGGGALDGAINAMRSAPTSGLAPAAALPCFTLPINELGNPRPITVTCPPRANSGAPLGGTPSQPGCAVTALSATASEGISVTSGKTILQGGAQVNKRLTVPTGATLDSHNYPVEAGQCSVTGTGKVLDSCIAGGAVADPNYPEPNATAAVLRTTLPACGPATLSLQPGIYRSTAALQAVLDCNDTTIVLDTGTYFFDFNAAGSHEVVFTGAARNSVLVGGARTGTTCDKTSPGVDLAFGGDSRLRVTSGKVDLCALVPVADSTAQHIVLRGLKAATNFSTTRTAIGTSAISMAGGTAWITPNNGAVPNTPPVTTTATIAGAGSPAVLRVALPAAVVPVDAVKIFATITVKESVNADAAGLATTETTATLLSVAGPALSAPLPLTTCTSPATPCANIVRDDTTTGPPIGPFTVADLNGATRAHVDVTLSKPGAGNAKGAVDGVTVDLTYELPIRPVCRLVSATTGCSAPWAAPTTPVLIATGAYATTPLALHGTVYAPTARIDLAMTGVTETVVDRGIVVRHLVLSMTPAVSPVAMISVPDLGRLFRRVLMIAKDSAGTQLARADVRFADAAGTANGDIPTVLEWSVG